MTDRRSPLRKSFRAQNMRGDIAVAQDGTNPVRPARRDLIHEIPRLSNKAPSLFGIGDAGERVHNGVEIRRDVKPEVLEIVACVDDDGQAVTECTR